MYNPPPPLLLAASAAPQSELVKLVAVTTLLHIFPRMFLDMPALGIECGELVLAEVTAEDLLHGVDGHDVPD